MKLLDMHKLCAFHALKSFADAQKEADRISKQEGVEVLPYDYGSNVWPRYGVCQPPQVGDEVSYSFNGDSYPCGVVTKVGKNHRMITVTDGTRFYRRKLQPRWLMTGGTWSLISGHHDDRNPEF